MFFLSSVFFLLCVELKYRQGPLFQVIVQNEVRQESFPRSLDLLKQILHLQVQVGLSFLGLFAEHLKRLHLFLLVPLDGFFSLLLVLQVLLGSNENE